MSAPELAECLAKIIHSFTKDELKLLIRVHAVAEKVRALYFSIGPLDANKEDREDMYYFLWGVFTSHIELISKFFPNLLVVWKQIRKLLGKDIEAVEFQMAKNMHYVESVFKYFACEISGAFGCDEDEIYT
jgi:hypothetical protein